MLRAFYTVYKDRHIGRPVALAASTVAPQQAIRPCECIFLNIRSQDETFHGNKQLQQPQDFYRRVFLCPQEIYVKFSEPEEIATDLEGSHFSNVREYMGFLQEQGLTYVSVVTDDSVIWDCLLEWERAGKRSSSKRYDQKYTDKFDVIVVRLTIVK